MAEPEIQEPSIDYKSTSCPGGVFLCNHIHHIFFHISITKLKFCANFFLVFLPGKILPSKGNFLPEVFGENLLKLHIM
ncbi:hypothetical protein H5410_038951 [Solanum commersonii]|uniref:Uncharacterized protein n=1 Tax=Solanum commersonii TaxID=4109 RepID=A0A9J5YCW4_SOLCO|nr:hypothetical protein H5410_038951 [Solanum commersonii]